MACNRLHSSIIVTHRCNSRCTTCNLWRHPTASGDEVRPADLDKLPAMFFTNLGGGEVFLRDDLDEVVAVLLHKTRRMVVSTNGTLTDKVLGFAERFPTVGIRISIDGLPSTHDAIRGRSGSFDLAFRTLLGLVATGHHDVGFAVTVQDRNSAELLALARLARCLHVELATGLVENAFYFRASHNRINARDEVARVLENLAATQVRSPRPKSWFRAYYNAGLAERARGGRTDRRCEMGGAAGFVTDPSGNVLPCNSHDEHLPLGNLREQSWSEIWSGPRADEVRRRVAACDKGCWAIGNVAPEIWRHPLRPVLWVLTAMLRATMGGRYVARRST